MAQPTTSFTNFIGPLFKGTAPPTVAQIGKPLEDGMLYFDDENKQFCVYHSDDTTWYCTPLANALVANAATTTSTTTTTTTTTSTSTTTSTTTTAT